MTESGWVGNEHDPASNGRQCASHVVSEFTKKPGADGDLVLFLSTFEPNMNCMQFDCSLPGHCRVTRFRK